MPPPPALAQHLTCVWTQSIGDGPIDDGAAADGQAGYLQRVLPDGCADIVCIDGSAPLVVGPAARAAVVALPVRSTIVGARFHPGRAPGLLGLPASELLNTEVSLRDVWGRAADRLADEVAGQERAEARLAALEAALVAHLPTARPVDDLVAAAVAWLGRHPTGRVHDLARMLGISDRHLRRRFRAAVGYGPKTLHRILRLQGLLALAGKALRGRLDLASLAARAGYADQAHMSREVARLAGVPPAPLLSNVGRLHTVSDPFNTAGGPVD